MTETELAVVEKNEIVTRNRQYTCTLETDKIMTDEEWNILPESETSTDTNADMLIDALQNVDDDEIAELVASYINCPSSDDCGYQGGSDHSPCIVCKAKWLRSTRE